jgi:hypothetical protein
VHRATRLLRAGRHGALLGGALVAVVLGVPAVAQLPSAERPTYRVGDTWTRTDGVYELKRIAGDVYVFARGSRNEVHLTRSLGLLKVVADGDVVWDVDDAPALRWPLERGRSGTTRTIVRSPLRVAVQGFSGPVQLSWSVDAVEELPISGNPVRAFRVTHVLVGTESVARGTMLGEFTVWYAPSMQRLVKLETTLPLRGLAFEAVAPPGPPAIALGPTTPATPSTPSAPAPATATVPAPAGEAPRIVINYPMPDTRVEREQIVVLGLVTGSAAIDRVQVTVNGVEVPQATTGGETRGVPVRVPAMLQPGENVVEVTATDRTGNVAQLVRTVTRVTPAPAAPPPPKVANRWAVVIGVGQYDHASIPPLRYATRDAEAVYRFLTTKGGYARDNVVLLTDTSEQKPTLQNIRRALGDFLYRKPGRDDMVLIYYAGHGAPEVDATGAEGDGIAKYLIPRNADPESLYSSALPMDEIQRIFSRIQSERVVLLLDTCYSGTAGGRTFARQQMRSGNLNDQFLERLTRSKGRVIITAAGPNEVALETSELGHGVFTYYVLQGLAGEADRDTDGVVTVSELYDYVEQQVDRKARAAGGRQRPLMKGEIEGTLPLSRVGR